LLVNCITVISSFIEKGKRPEIYELTDNEVPILRVTLQETDLKNIKYEVIHHENSFKHYIQKKYSKQLISLLNSLNEINFNDIYPGYNLNKLLPQLKINKKGFVGIKNSEILEGYKLMEDDFEKFDFSNDEILNRQLLEYNHQFNITHILYVFNNIFRHETDLQLSICSHIGSIFKPIEKYDILYAKKFKTKKSFMIVELNGKKKEFKKLTFKLGGRSSNDFGKPCFNIKIRGKDNLYGLIDFKLRPGARDATYLRSKLACDIHNRLGLPSISANYVSLYINNEYMGLYILMDAIKLSWISTIFNDEETLFLYKCDELKYGLTAKSSDGCTNENENVNDHTEWLNFLTKIDRAQSLKEVENIMDIDLFLKEIALEYLFGSWDHFPSSDHNFYFYKGKNDKWKYLIYDFDAEFGQDLINCTISYSSQNNDTKFNHNILFARGENENYDYSTFSFADWIKTNKSHIINILILDNPTRFTEILKEIVVNVFNPDILFPHIDKLKEFIKPYVELDKTMDENGNYPGQWVKSVGIYSLAQWDANSEFTTIHNFLLNTDAYGLKYWILAKYKYLCNVLNLECNKYYMENYDFTINDVYNEYIKPSNDITYSDNNNKELYSNKTLMCHVNENICWLEDLYNIY
jgi:hypothetical protein